MKAKEAEELGERLANLSIKGEVEEAANLLDRLLSQRTPFAMLDRVGRRIGQEAAEAVDPLLLRIGQGRKMGGWVMIASALGCRLPLHTARCLAQAREFIIYANIWYATDIFGERMTGPAMLLDFYTALDVLAAWRKDASHWVRRCIGVGVHLWAKRMRGAFGTEKQAGEILDFLEPAFEESAIEAVKGLGWGLKTMGRYYPDLVSSWLEEQVVYRHRRPSATLLRKSLTYLPPEQRARINRGRPG